MPVLFKVPRNILSFRSAYIQYPSLVSRCDLPEEAAVALIYYSHAGTTSGKMILSDMWRPDLQTGDTLEAKGVSQPQKAKIFCAVSLGPEGSNPEKRIWAGLRYGSTYFHCVGYYTYDDIVIIPEVTSADRDDYLFYGDGATNGWGGSTWSGDGSGAAPDSWSIRNIWDIPQMRQLDSRTPTGLLFDHQYSHVHAFPTHADLLDMGGGVSAMYAQSVAGFDANGDCQVRGNATPSSQAALIGYFVVPLSFYMATMRTPHWFLPTQVGVEYTHNMPKEASHVLVYRPQKEPQGEDFYVRPDASWVGVHGSDVDWQTSGLGMILSGITDERTFTMYTNSDANAYIVYTTIVGYFLKYQSMEGVTIDCEDLTLTAPEYYYPSDNTGSLHSDYSIEGQAYSFSDIDDLQFHLSGGAGNTDPHASLGGVASTTLLIEGANSIFSDPTPQHVQGLVDLHRCIYLTNVSAETAHRVNIWWRKVGLGIVNLYIGEDPAGIGGTAQTVASQMSNPSDVDFILAQSKQACYTIRELGPGQSIPIWLRMSFTDRYFDGPTPATGSFYLNMSVLDNGA